MSGPWAFWKASDITRITGCPLAAVEAHWPLIAAALERRGIYDRDVSLGVLPTVAIETASTFRPIHEYGTPEDWAGYFGGAAYAGRGFIQLTHLGNYRAAGDALGLDLAGNPDLALDPTIAADILAWYWATRGVKSKDGTRWWSLADLCHEHDWEWVRRVVQGRTAGLDRLIAQASALDSYAAPTEEPAVPTAPRVVFDRNFPATIQDDDWSCAPSSLDWALRSLGRTPGHSYIEGLLVKDGIVSHQLGLLDATGRPLAAWIGRKEPPDVYYGADGFYGNNDPDVSFAELAAEFAPACPYPGLIGGRNYGGGGRGHWVGLRGYDPASDRLLIANPAGMGGSFGGDSLTRAEFARRGPFSLVRVLHPDLLGPVVPTPPPLPTPPAPITRAELDAALAPLLALRDRWSA